MVIRWQPSRLFVLENKGRTIKGLYSLVIYTVSSTARDKAEDASSNVVKSSWHMIQYHY